MTFNSSLETGAAFPRSTADSRPGRPERHAAKPSKFVFFPGLRAALVLGTLLPMLAAGAPSDCIGESADGRANCSTAETTPWGYGMCDNYAAYQFIDSYWCQAAGGSWQGYWVPNEGPCRGASPASESNLVAIAAAFAKLFSGPTAKLDSDSGWNGSDPIGSLCGTPGREWDKGKLVRDNRILSFVYQDGPGGPEGKLPIYASRVREAYCPAGTTARSNNGVFLGCAHPVAQNKCGSGNPILPGVATKFQVEVDGMFEGRALKRYYSSKGSVHYFASAIPAEVADSDTAWRGVFDIRLEPVTNPYVMAAVSMPDGTIQYFRPDGRALLSTEYNKLTLKKLSNGYLLYMDGELLEFTLAGRLTRLIEASGKQLTFRYSDGTVAGPNGQSALGPDGEPYTEDFDGMVPVPPGHLFEVQSSNGRFLRFKRDPSGHITQMQLPGSAAPIKFYHGLGKLLRGVTYPDGSGRGYHYGEAEHTAGTQRPSALTGISVIDPFGQISRFATFRYNADGAPISTEHANGVEKFELSYSAGTLQTTVKDPRGSERVLSFADVHGVLKPTTSSQPAGSGCAASTSNRGYDAAGNLAFQDDFNGTRICYVHDATRNTETLRVEGLTPATSCDSVTPADASLPANSRKTSTQWHPDWQLAVKVAEPGRVITRVYNGQPDPFNANALASCAPSTALLPDGKPIVVLCKQVEQATTDANGASGFAAELQAGVASRQTAWTYNGSGQVLTEDGPRTDVNDIVTYTYYTDTTADHTIGDLKQVTNASMKTVQYTKYNRQGQVLQVVDANNLTTVNTYDSKQRLKTVSVGGRTVSYDYDPADNLKKITQPDMSWLGYDYDAGNRLVAVYDHIGNRIDYVLDNAGTRIGENTKDPGGTLRRQLLRSFDGLGRVQQTTGRE